MSGASACHQGWSGDSDMSASELLRWFMSHFETTRSFRVKRVMDAYVPSVARVALTSGVTFIETQRSVSPYEVLLKFPFAFEWLGAWNETNHCVENRHGA